MQEIADNVFIVHNSLGLVAGIIQNEHGVVLIDCPSRHDEANSWREFAARASVGKPRYMVVMDTNYDRVLSIRGSESILVAHADTIAPIRSRLASLKIADETGSHETHETPGSSNRMQTPELHFDQKMSLHLDRLSIDLEHHPGSNIAGLWAIIPERKVVFVGDSVLIDQPPFLAYSNLDRWEQDLKELASKRFKDYQIVSARSGLVDKEQVKTMAKHISFINKTFEKLCAAKAPLEEWYAKIPVIIDRMSKIDLFNSELFYNRLHWGITTYYEINCRERG